MGRVSILHTAAASPGRSWAFGISVPEGSPFGTLIFRRGEAGWQQTDAPDIGRVNRAVALSDTDVWAVGDGVSIHWDGTQWQEEPTAVLETSRAQLFGLAEFGSHDVWAAGYAPRRDHSGSRGTVQHWDGAAWEDLPVPAVSTAWALSGIDGMSSDDLWAVGRGKPGQGAALHWDGRDWQQVPVPTPESEYAKLCDVTALASNDVWAAGYWTPPAGGAPARQPFAVHWDGRAWSLGTLPPVPGEICQLVKDGPAIWAIGHAPDSTPLVARLNSSAWQLLPGPPPPAGSRHSSLHGGAVLNDKGLLVVGATTASQDSVQPFAAVLHR